MGLDTVDMYVSKNDIGNIRYGGAYDFIKAGITLSHAVGMKYMIRISEYSFTSSGVLNSWAEFVDSSTEQTSFLEVFEWILITYPNLDGIEIEESEGETDDPTIAQKYRTFKNMFLTKEKNLVKKYHPETGFTWSINSGNSWMSTLYFGGYDFDYIISNHLIDHYFMQTNQYNMQQFIDRITEIETKFSGSGIKLGSWVYSDRANTDCTGQIKCYNQEIVPFMKYLIEHNIIIAIFNFYRNTWIESSFYPGFEYLGSTLGEIIKTVLSEADTGPIQKTKTIKVVEGNGKVEVYKNNILVGTALPSTEVVVIFDVGDVIRFVAIPDSGLTFIKTCDETSKLCYSQGYQDYSFTINADSKTQILGYYFTSLPLSVYVCESPRNGYEKDQYGNRRLNTNCNPACVPTWKCETPLNGYESDGCGNRRLNSACNPPEPTLASIVVTPATATIGLDKTITLTALAKNNLGDVMAGVPITWSVDQGGIIDINPVETATFTDGKAQTIVTGITEGLVTVTALSGSVTGQMVIDVNAAAQESSNYLLMWLGIGALGLFLLNKKK
jgi:hypothetical protein